MRLAYVQYEIFGSNAPPLSGRDETGGCSHSRELDLEESKNHEK